MFSQEVADAVCSRIANGESLRKAAKAQGTSLPAFLDWCNARPELADQYARAMATRMELMAEEILEISDESITTVNYDGDNVELSLDSTAVQRNRLRVDTRKWLMSKMAPKKYGDKMDVNHAGTVSLAHELAKLGGG